MFGVRRPPERQGWGQAFATELLGVFPNVCEHVAHGQLLGRGAGGRWAFGFGQGVAEQFDGVLATVAVLLAKFVEHPALAVFVAAGVTLPPPLKLLVSIQWIWHVHPHRFGCPFPVRQRMLFPLLFPPPSVSFILSQLAARAPSGFFLD